jgi:O-antigen/teichoic acid export membrane protein
MTSALRNVVVLVSGAAGAQILAFAALPLLTRIFTPEQFGHFGAFVTGAQIVALFLGARYDQAIMLMTTRSTRDAMVGLAVVVTPVLAAILALAIWSTYTSLDRAFGTSLGSGWLWLLVAAILTHINFTLTTLAIRVGQERIATISRLGKAAIAVLVQLSLGFAAVSAGGINALIIGELVSLFAVAAFLSVRLRRVGELLFVERIRCARFRHGMLALAYRYRQYPLINAPHAVISALSGWLTLAYLTASFSPADAGQYFVMFRIVMMPASLIASAVSQVYFRTSSDLAGKGQSYAHVYQRFAGLLLAIGVSIAVILAFGGALIFTFVLGNAWEVAGRCAAAFAPYVALHLVLSAMAPTVMVAGRLKAGLLVSIGQTVTYLAGLWLGHKMTATLEGAVAGAAMLSVPYLLAMGLWYWHLSKQTRLRTE